MQSHVKRLILTAYKGGNRYRLSEKETVTKQEEYIQFKSEVKHDKETEQDILTIIF